MTTEASTRIRDFFRSQAVLDFHEEHSRGETPWAAVYDALGRIVVTDADRSVFYVVAEEGTSVSASFSDDALHVVDPESESLEKIGDYDDAASAFEAVLAHAGLSEDPSPSV